MDSASRPLSEEEFMQLLVRAEASHQAADDLGTRTGLHLTMAVGLAMAAIGATATIAGVTSLPPLSVIIVMLATATVVGVYLGAVVLPLVRRRRTELYFLEEAVSILRAAVDVFDWQGSGPRLPEEDVRLRLARFPAEPSRYRGA